MLDSVTFSVTFSVTAFSCFPHSILMKGRGGRIDARLNERILSAVGAVNDIADVNGVADHLRSKHPEYKRHKYIPFATQVGFALQHLHSTGKVRPPAGAPYATSPPGPCSCMQGRVKMPIGLMIPAPWCMWLEHACMRLE